MCAVATRTEMALRKIKPIETAKDRAVQDRVRRAKTTRSPVDRTSKYHEQIGELARACGVTFDVVYEEFSERAAAREYLGGVSRDEAEFAAMGDVRERFA